MAFRILNQFSSKYLKMTKFRSNSGQRDVRLHLSLRQHCDKVWLEPKKVFSPLLGQGEMRKTFNPKYSLVGETAKPGPGGRPIDRAQNKRANATEPVKKGISKQDARNNMIDVDNKTQNMVNGRSRTYSSVTKSQTFDADGERLRGKSRQVSQADILERFRRKDFKPIQQNDFLSFQDTECEKEDVYHPKKLSVPYKAYSDRVKMYYNNSSAAIYSNKIPPPLDAHKVDDIVTRHYSNKIPPPLDAHKVDDIVTRHYSNEVEKPLNVNNDTKNIIDEWNSGRNVRIDDLLEKHSSEKLSDMYYGKKRRKNRSHSERMSTEAVSNTYAAANTRSLPKSKQKIQMSSTMLEREL